MKNNKETHGSQGIQRLSKDLCASIIVTITAV